MFTGIIKTVGQIVSIVYTAEGVQIQISFHIPNHIICQGDSVAVNGVCLTVKNEVQSEVNNEVQRDVTNHKVYTFDVMNQTLNKTNLNTLQIGSQVNIETALDHGQIDGHFVAGHVDCTVKLVSIVDNEYIFEYPAGVCDLIRDKGSVAIDGVSLTVSQAFGGRFSVNLIPYTSQNTIFASYKVGSICNIETDIQLKQSCNNYGNVFDLYGTTVFSSAQAMHIAHQLSLLGKFDTAPNPFVGCVITQNNKIIGMGYHKRAGDAHAEINAVNDVLCREKTLNCLKNSTFYVTLEPCSHFGKTPPCVDTLVKHSIHKVVIGIKDPDCRVSGNGIKILQENKIQVEVLDDEEVKASLKEYIYQRTYSLPYVYLKMAMSLNAKVSSTNHDKYISSKSAREDVHHTRRKVQCILTTADTVLADMPELTVRLPNMEPYHPLIAVLDRTGKITTAVLSKLSWNLDKVIIFTGNETTTPTSENKTVTNLNVKVIPLCDGKLDVLSACKELFKLGIISVLCEVGPTVFSHILKQKLYQELHIYKVCKFFQEGEIAVFNDNIENLGTIQKTLIFEDTVKIEIVNK